MPVPLLDVNAQNHPLEAEFTAAFQRVFKSGQFIMGPEVEALEKEICALTGAKHELAFDAGLTWTDEDPVFGDGDESTGALLGLAYVWKITEHAAFRQRLIYYPNFDTSDDWRLRSESTLEAALASSWALRVGYLYTNDNLPTPGFGETDTTTSVSLVWKR